MKMRKSHFLYESKWKSHHEIKDKSKGDVVTCSVVETGDYGVKVKIGDKGPITIIKKSDLAL